MWQVNCDWSTSYQYDVNDQWSLTIQTQRFTICLNASRPLGQWTYQTYVLFSICDIVCVKEGKRELSRKVEEIKDWERQSELSRDPATRRYLQTPNHRTSWTFPGCKAVNHKNFGFKKLNIFTQPVLYNREAPRASKAPLQNSRPKRFEKQNNRSKILEKHVDPKFPNFASFC